jgi:hypothetical protein
MHTVKVGITFLTKRTLFDTLPLINLSICLLPYIVFQRLPIMDAEAIPISHEIEYNRCTCLKF